MMLSVDAAVLNERGISTETPNALMDITSPTGDAAVLTNGNVSTEAPTVHIHTTTSLTGDAAVLTNGNVSTETHTVHIHTTTSLTGDAAVLTNGNVSTETHTVHIHTTTSLTGDAAVLTNGNVSTETHAVYIHTTTSLTGDAAVLTNGNVSTETHTVHIHTTTSLTGDAAVLTNGNVSTETHTVHIHTTTSLTGDAAVLTNGNVSTETHTVHIHTTTSLTGDAAVLTDRSAPSYHFKLDNTTGILNKSVEEIESSLINTKFLEQQDYNEEDKLEMAAKVGTALLEENNYLKEKFLRLESKLAYTEKQLEEADTLRILLLTNPPLTPLTPKNTLVKNSKTTKPTPEEQHPFSHTLPKSNETLTTKIPQTLNMKPRTMRLPSSASLLYIKNICGLGKIVYRLNHILNDTKPNLVILTEHGLKKEEIWKTHIEDYSLIAEYSREHHTLGGVAMYAKQPLVQSSMTIDVSHLCQELSCEVTIAKIKCLEGSIYFLGIYPLSCINILTNILDHIEAHNKSIVTMGDINVDNMKLTVENTLLKDVLCTYNIRRLLLPATSITHETATSIDCVPTYLKTTVSQA
ncbi:hypothetical protein J6590_061266 [Homalodisca vitripennis]|nr:hypothetical protein J6590_061266 [Homalodisca vitripennis]